MILFRLQMVDWSSELGSDITFFLSQGTAYCTGRGEILQPIIPPLQIGTSLCIVKPNVGLSTPAVFKAIDYGELSTLDPGNTLLPTFLQGIDNVPNDYFVNDLEPPAFRCVPLLAQLKTELLSVDGFQHVMMSGSGTSIFCLGVPSDMETFQNRFVKDRNDVQVFFAKFISRQDGEWFKR
jgi:4-diphosphocytidyl-2-C-methyl-D-erythritol kinase